MPAPSTCLPVAGCAHELALVGSRPGPPDGDAIAFGDQVLDCQMKVREGLEVPLTDLQPGLQIQCFLDTGEVRDEVAGSRTGEQWTRHVR